MQFIAEGLGGAIGGGTVAVVIRDSCLALTIMAMRGGDTADPCLGSKAE